MEIKLQGAKNLRTKHEGQRLKGEVKQYLTWGQRWRDTDYDARCI